MQSKHPWLPVDLAKAMTPGQGWLGSQVPSTTRKVGQVIKLFTICRHEMGMNMALSYGLCDKRLVREITENT